MDEQSLKALALAVLDTEARAVENLKARIDADFVRACQCMLNCQGRVVVTGMGKSGHIGNKIAATLASTGTPAFFLHPGEASHGDLGMVTSQDVVLALSNSGETAELLMILPMIRRMGAPLIAMTGKPASTLARNADVHLNVAVDQEACPLGLAPTASTTAALAMGDALAVALLESRGFTADDFARSHPAGALGKRLLLQIRDIMHTGDALPTVQPQTPLRDALLEMTHKRLGLAIVVDAEQRLLGVFTDGDLRRTLDQAIDIRNIPIEQVMTGNPHAISAHKLAVEAARMMEEHQINALPVVDEQGRLIGALNIHDLFQAGVL